MSIASRIMPLILSDSLPLKAAAPFVILNERRSRRPGAGKGRGRSRTVHMSIKEHSIFNDVLGPVMVGPSSSHSAGCARIGLAVRNLWGRDIRKAEVVYDTAGSYPATHVGQGSDRGFAGGLLGFATGDPRIKDSLEIAKEMGVEIDFRIEPLTHRHPNEARIDVYGDDGRVGMSVLTHSTGGGTFRILEVDGAPADIDGGRDIEVVCPDGTKRRSGVVLPVPMRGCPPVFSDAASALAFAGDKKSLAELALAYETSIGEVDEEAVRELAISTLAVMRRSVVPPAGDAQVFGFRRYQAEDMIQKASEGGLLDTGILGLAMMHAVSAMENSCAHNVVAAAPTAGSCGVVPAALLSAGEALGLSDDELADALLACGMAGAVIANRATFAAEEAGCQAENGAASAMAAAGLVHLMGGTAAQGFAAASLALQNMLGLICDPVGGLTEIPCIGRNVSAVSNAVTAANMVMAGFDPMIPFDETVEAMLAVGRQLPPGLRCTCGGGLCDTPCGRRLADRSADL